MLLCVISENRNSRFARSGIFFLCFTNAMSRESTGSRG